jgi:hypothetical protein
MFCFEPAYTKTIEDYNTFVSFFPGTAGHFFFSPGLNSMTPPDRKIKDKSSKR